MNIPILWINLARRKDRAAWFADRNISVFPQLNWIRVAGYDFWWDAIAQSEPKATSHGHAACWLSHKLALQVGLATGADRFVVLEDDALLGPEFLDALSLPVNHGQALKITGTMAGTYAILYSAEAARKILSMMDLREGNFDQRFENSGIYEVSQKPFATHFGGFDSDTEFHTPPKPVDPDYSQHGEQKVIRDFFNGKVGRFLDLGAYDGIEGSNSRGLSDLTWNGLCVEANPFTFAKLVQNHAGNQKIQCLNAAVAPSPGVARFWDTGGQVSTILKDHSVGQWVQREYSVACVTPDQIVKEFGNDFDFISIDIEGMDLDVLKVSERLVERASLICIEHTQPAKGFNADYYAEVRRVMAFFGFKKLVASIGNGGVQSSPETASNSILSRV